MNILIIGKGAREHSLAWKIAKSPLKPKVFVADGNAGTEDVGENVEINGDISKWCKNNDIELVVVGPEAPLVEGIGDKLKNDGILVVAPSKFSAQLEGSKKFTKDMCRNMNIPTAQYKSFTDTKHAKEFLKENEKYPVVVKFDGLAGGKGVIIAENVEDATNAVDLGFEHGGVIVVEEFLEGTEASMFFLCDGETAMPLGTAQDYKRISDGDKGPNTGGMGAISPAPIITNDVEKKVMKEIVEPTLQYMRDKQNEFQGILYAGLMINDGQPYLIEYNVRFGDPECEAIMMKIESDILVQLIASAKGELAGAEPVEWYKGNTMTLIMAGEKYPETSSETPKEIIGLDKVDDPDVMVFHGNTAKKENKIMALGGRVLAVTAKGENLEKTREKAYKTAEKINWGSQFYRRDIGK